MKGERWKIFRTDSHLKFSPLECFPPVAFIAYILSACLVMPPQKPRDTARGTSARRRARARESAWHISRRVKYYFIRISASRLECVARFTPATVTTITQCRVSSRQTHSRGLLDSDGLLANRTCYALASTDPLRVRNVTGRELRKSPRYHVCELTLKQPTDLYLQLDLSDDPERILGAHSAAIAPPSRPCSGCSKSFPLISGNSLLAKSL